MRPHSPPFTGLPFGLGHHVSEFFCLSTFYLLQYLDILCSLHLSPPLSFVHLLNSIAWVASWETCPIIQLNPNREMFSFNIMLRLGIPEWSRNHYCPWKVCNLAREGTERDTNAIKGMELWDNRITFWQIDWQTTQIYPWLAAGYLCIHGFCWVGKCNLELSVI